MKKIKTIINNPGFIKIYFDDLTSVTIDYSKPQWLIDIYDAKIELDNPVVEIFVADDEFGITNNHIKYDKNLKNK